MSGVFYRLKAVKTLVLSDFPIGDKSINARYLQGQMTDLRRVVLERKAKVHYSVFSPWRKQAGCSGTEEISKRCALLIVFLAVYGRSGKDVCGLKAIELPTGLELDKHCGAWLAALPSRPECADVYKVLNKVIEDLPTPEVISKAETLPKQVSLRTLQRRAQKGRETLLGKANPSESSTKASKSVHPSVSTLQSDLMAQLLEKAEKLSDEKLRAMIDFLN